MPVELSTDTETGHEVQDAELVRRILAGDTEAFAPIVSKYKDRIYQFVRWQGMNEDAAEETAQEIFVEAFKSLRSVKGNSAFSTWLYGLARNICLARFRKQCGPGSFLQEPEDFLEIPDGSDLVAALERDEAARLVRQKLEELPSIYREILLLREWENMSYEELAAALRIPLGTVRSRLHNATVRLAEKLNPGPHGGQT